MAYVRTAGMSTAARRARRRTALILTSLVAGLLLVLALSTAVAQGWISLPGGDGETDKTATSAPVPTVAVAPKDVTVNVLNATSTAGLAGKTADALKAREFKVGDVGNADGSVEGAGEIRYGTKGKAGAQLLRSVLPSKMKLVDDKRQSAAIDLVLGPQWKPIPAADEAAASDG